MHYLNRLFSVLLGLFCLVATPLHAASNSVAVTPEPPPQTVLVWGDSLSAAYGIPVEKGWVSLLQAKLGDAYKVINGSISGETTDGGLTRLPDALRTHQPQFVLIELGANDGLRGLPVGRMQDNLDKMIKLVGEAKAKTVLIGIKLPPNYGMAYTEQFDKVYADLASQYSLPLIPFLLEGVALDYKLMQEDGLHPTAEAQPLILEHVWKTLEPALKPATTGQ